jgi:putative heme-binding domain-containing protein
MCVTCHGNEGAGGDAPSLNRPRLARAPDDEAIAFVIENGIPNTGMPRLRRLTENERRQLVAYVRFLGKVTPTQVNGDPRKGAEIYKKVGCASCHIVNGEGGSFGPTLTEIGALRGAAYLRQAVVDPAAALPKGTLAVPARGFAEYLPVVAVTREGREVRGVRVNEDVFTIQLRDGSNRFHSLRKSDLASLVKQTGTSFMPSSGNRVTGSELDDLVAYLVSLRGVE